MIELADIPAGNFVRGGHTITLSAFKMSKFQVTQELYEAVMGNNPSWFQGTATDRVVAAGEIQGKRPVETVTWFDAVMFCNKLSEREGLTPFYTITDITMTGNNITEATVETVLTANGYRLPTEAQWEYACRAGSTTNWHFGNDEAQLVNYAWYWDRWSTTFPDPGNLNNPAGPSDGDFRVLRGGSWDSSASLTQSAIRGFNWPGSGADCVKNPNKPCNVMRNIVLKRK
jgi:formylglycine-generating enzyme required for sulfatase activity